jgi:hypothetical protein
MTHPKSSDVLKVIEGFKKVLPKAGRLDMGQCAVNVGHTCGTVHCHAGWFAVAVCDLNKRLDYSHGRDAMAEILGLRPEDITQWAHRFPDVWGNNFGLYMFGASYAFFHSEKRPDGAVHLQHIVDHWTDVYERLKALEAPVYVDITKELAVLPKQEVPDKEVIHEMSSL